MKVLLFLGQKPLKSEVALIIWVSLSMSTMCV